MDFKAGPRGYSNLVDTALKTMVKPTPASVTELAFTPGALARKGALDGVHAILFYAQNHCVMQLTDTDVVAVAGFTSSGGLVITIGDSASRQDTNRNTGATACTHVGTGSTDALSAMYERVFGWANVTQATSSILQNISRQNTAFVKDAAATKGTVFEIAGPARLSATVTRFSALEMASAAKIPGERAMYVSGNSTYAAVWTAPFGKGNVLYLGWNWWTLGFPGDRGGADWTTALEAGLRLAPACGHGGCASGSTAATKPPTPAAQTEPAPTTVATTVKVATTTAAAAAAASIVPNSTAAPTTTTTTAAAAAVREKSGPATMAHTTAGSNPVLGATTDNRASSTQSFAAAAAIATSTNATNANAIVTAALAGSTSTSDSATASDGGTSTSDGVTTPGATTSGRDPRVTDSTTRSTTTAADESSASATTSGSGTIVVVVVAAVLVCLALATGAAMWRKARRGGDEAAAAFRQSTNFVQNQLWAGGAPPPQSPPTSPGGPGSGGPSSGPEYLTGGGPSGGPEYLTARKESFRGFGSAGTATTDDDMYGKDNAYAEAEYAEPNQKSWKPTPTQAATTTNEYEYQEQAKPLSAEYANSTVDYEAQAEYCVPFEDPESVAPSLPPSPSRRCPQVPGSLQEVRGDRARKQPTAHVN